MLNKLKTFIKLHLPKIDLIQCWKQFVQDVFKMPLSLMSHPISGFDDFKREKTSKGYVAIFYLVMMIFTQVIAYNANGFLVNKNNPKDFNLLFSIALVIFPVVIAVIANWATTALMDGKGTMTDIFRVITYSFFPYVWLGLLATIISNFITADEVIFFTFFQSAGAILMVYMMFFGLLGIHEYGLFKTIMMLVFTIVAVAFLLFIMLLFLSLIQQMWAFVSSIYQEFVMRFL
ncbi:MAG: Yip1 family protein [Candidatus Izemoplasmatales bacterium]|nr:Yip1 family protein [Candidatus Izemoplasmatales bacterium]